MPIRLPRPRILLALALSAVLALSLGGTALARQRIRVEDNRFDPRRVRVDQGERVVWRNVGANNHTVTATGTGWSKNARLSPGETTAFRFDAGGVYRYHCRIHANMDGRIRVG
jgi:plastocyanin